MRTCPLCKKSYTPISLHLKRLHGVNNLDERKILMGIVNKNLNLRKCKCYRLHLSGNPTGQTHGFHVELNAERKASIMGAYVKEVATSLLAKLQATNPTPAVASTLDLVPEEEEQAEDTEQAEACDRDGCRAILTRCMAVEKELDAIRRTHRKLRRKFLHLQAQGVSHLRVPTPSSLPRPSTTAAQTSSSRGQTPRTSTAADPGSSSPEAGPSTSTPLGCGSKTPVSP